MDGAFAPDDPLCASHVARRPPRHTTRALRGVRSLPRHALHGAQFVARRAALSPRTLHDTQPLRRTARKPHVARQPHGTASRRDAQHTAALRYRPPLPRPQSKPSRSPSGNEACRKPTNQAASRASTPQPSSLVDAHRPLAHSSPPAYRSSASPRAATPRAAGTRAASACRCAGTAAPRRACTLGSAPHRFARTYTCTSPPHPSR